MTHDVFISYSADDRPIADAMCSTLESNGLRCWMAPRDILPGMDWGGSIIDAIAASRVMVLVLSANSNTSSQVKREVERAVNKDVIVIPFRVEDVSLSKSLEYQLSSTHWMDALTPPLEDHLQTLAEKIGQILSTDSPRETPAPKKGRTPIQPVPPFYKRRTVYLGGLVIGLIVVLSLALWVSLKNSTPESTATLSTPTPTPTTTATPTPRSEPTNAQEKVAASPNQNVNQNQSSNTSIAPNTSGELSVPKIYARTYDAARKLLIREGWQPNERHISHGNDPEAQMGNGPIFWKRGYRELVTCSGSALAECLFEFIDPTERVLVVVTQGEEDENGAYHATVKRTVIKPK